MQMTNQEYDAYIQKLSPKSPLWKDVCFAFLIGGAICALAQLIQNWKSRRFLTDAHRDAVGHHGQLSRSGHLQCRGQVRGIFHVHGLDGLTHGPVRDEDHIKRLI
mgnify:CR=1 FL=1